MHREQIKWAPFESLYHGKDIIKEIELKETRKIMPILSEDNLLDLQTNILNAYHTASLIQIKYFNKGRIFSKTGIIKTIANNHTKIYFEDDSFLYFEQILEINFI